MPAPAVGDPTQRFAHEGSHKYLVRKLGTGEAASDVIANFAAPTVAELEDAEMFDISRYMPKNGGLTGDPNEQYIDSSDQSETFDAQQVGSFGWQPTLELYMQHPDNNAFDYFSYGDIFVWVDIYTADADSPKDGDACVVALLECHQPKPLTFATNEKQRFRMGCAVQEEPAYDAVVVAS